MAVESTTGRVRLAPVEESEAELLGEDPAHRRVEAFLGEPSVLTAELVASRFEDPQHAPVPVQVLAAMDGPQTQWLLSQDFPMAARFVTMLRAMGLDRTTTELRLSVTRISIISRSAFPDTRCSATLGAVGADPG